MDEIDKGLYKALYDSLVVELKPQTEEEYIAVSHTVLVVGKAAEEYTSELREAIKHLRETVRRINV